MKHPPLSSERVEPTHAVAGRVAGAYARVSTGHQEHEQTIQAQVAEIKQKVLERGDHLADENVFVDDGWTGEILQRPGLDAMREAALSKRFQVLYVYDRGRLSRVFAYQEILIEEIEGRGVAFESLNDGPAETPEEKVMQAMKGVFHQYERVKIAERFRLGKLHKAKRGVLINGRLPYGYKRFSRTDKAAAYGVIDKDEATTVRLVRDWFGNDGLSMYAIIKRLHQLGISPPKGLTECWSKVSIVRLLKNPVYHTGLVHFNKTEAIIPKRPYKLARYRRVRKTSRVARPQDEWIAMPVPAIVPNDGLYERIQARLAQNERYAPRNRKYNYLLVGKIFCGCGNRSVGDGYAGKHYYRCTEKTSKYPLSRGSCRFPGVNAVKLDSLLWGEITKSLKNKALMRESARAWLQAQQTRTIESELQVADLEQLLAQVSEEEERYARAYGAGTIRFEQFRKLMADLKRRRRMCEQELAGTPKVSDAVVNEQDVEHLCDDAARFVGSLRGTDKGYVVRELVDRAVVGQDRSVDVWVQLPEKPDKVGEQNEDRHSPGETPLLEFKIKIHVPRRTGTVISARDERGRIVHSRPLIERADSTAA
jgi:site-specific DNA recombinase